MRRMFAIAALVLLLPMGTALAHDDHEHQDTLERLLDAGVPEEEAIIIAEHFDELDALQESYYAEDHGHDEGGFWDETIHILTDPAHWIAEFAAEILFLILIHYWIMEKVIHRHRFNGAGAKHQ